MSRLVGSWPWFALIAAAAVLGAVAGSGSADDSPFPSVTNPGPRGAKVAATWLAERGGRTRILETSTLPVGAEVVVLAAPTERTVTETEVVALKQFVERGGTLIYLSPRPASAQPELKHWLGLTDTQATASLATDATMGDVGGATLAVRSSHPLLRGVKQLRVSADTGLDAEGATSIAGNALWLRSFGEGEIWIAAGADLLENRRFDLLDNAQLWTNLGNRQLAFDEFHLTAAQSPPWSANLWATLAQLIFVALLFVAARAPRLGPARPALRRQHRSSLEYVASIAALMERANVEGEVKLKLRKQLRRLMQDRLGIPLGLPTHEASRQLALHTGLGAGAFAELDRELLAASSGFARVAAEAARLEDAIVGRSAP